jgi:cobalt/nickel transport system permease protein
MKARLIIFTVLVAAFLMPATAQAMHITEGILPPKWAGLWFAVAIPFVAWGLRDLRVRSKREPLFKPMVGLIGSAVFVISCMPIPVPTAGTCSHPCGTGLAAILIGAPLTAVVSSVALLLQALFLSHGGLTTLGGNITSMGIVGAFTGWGVFCGARKLGMPVWGAAFLTGLLSDWATYAMTSFELASALHGSGSLLRMFAAIGVSFMPTQIPLGIVEGVLTASVYQFIVARRPELLESLGVQIGSHPEQKREGAE